MKFIGSDSHSTALDWNALQCNSAKWLVELSIRKPYDFEIHIVCKKQYHSEQNKLKYFGNMNIWKKLFSYFNLFVWKKATKVIHNYKVVITKQLLHKCNKWDTSKGRYIHREMLSFAEENGESCKMSVADRRVIHVMLSQVQSFVIIYEYKFDVESSEEN